MHDIFFFSFVVHKLVEHLAAFMFSASNLANINAKFIWNEDVERNDKKLKENKNMFM